MDLGYYRGRAVLVTGATSGNGLALALRLHALGAKVVAMGRNDGRLEELHQQGMRVYKLDLADPAGIDRYCEIGHGHCAFDDIFHLAGNAPFGVLTDDEMRAFEAADLTGPIRLLTGLLPRMRAGGTVAVVTSASVGLGDIPDLRAYQQVKRGMVGWWSRNRGLYLAHGVNLMLISMGFIGTDIWDRAPGFPHWLGRLVRQAVPPPERFVDGLLADAASWESVSYPGWLAGWARVDEEGRYALDPWARLALTVAGRVGLRALRPLGGR